MNNITEIVWDIITDNEALLSELTRIMCQEYEPFLTDDKATTVNTFKLESYFRGELAKWYEWLPERPIDMIGGELAMEALRHVDWKHLASLILDELQVAG
jgi:hypothetical protein